MYDSIGTLTLAIVKNLERNIVLCLIKVNVKTKFGQPSSPSLIPLYPSLFCFLFSSFLLLTYLLPGDLSSLCLECHGSSPHQPKSHSLDSADSSWGRSQKVAEDCSSLPLMDRMEIKEYDHSFVCNLWSWFKVFGEVSFTSIISSID